MADRTCATRSLKVARHLQRTRPDIVPATEPLEGFGAILEGTDPGLRFVLRDVFGPGGVPKGSARAAGPLFSGTLTFVHLAISAKGRTYGVPPTDLAVAIRFLTGAAAPISRYASQYGANSLAVAPTPIELLVSVPNGIYNDSTLQGWVNGLVASQRLPAGTSALVVLNPQGPLNSDADPSRGVLGYHGKANVPYAFVNVTGTGLAIDDPADVYALALSHEIAEMTVDPTADLANPEVCDPCGPNCQTVIRAYFDASGTYVDATTDFPPSFPYAFYLNSIVRPGQASQCPAPTTACAYAPPSPAARR
ncbi:MAG TPA: hypothetical protein VJQ43_04585 [Thermoplasmata archaeon]|nr:hypothetical protein [Thermoplasmata archaeon]